MISDQSLELSILGSKTTENPFKTLKRAKSAGFTRSVGVNLRQHHTSRFVSRHSNKKVSNSDIHISSQSSRIKKPLVNASLSREQSMEFLDVPNVDNVELFDKDPHSSSFEIVDSFPQSASIASIDPASATKFLTIRDQSALKLGKLVLAAVFEKENKPTTAESISRFFFDAWLNRKGSSLNKADTLSIELLCAMQKLKLSKSSEAENVVNSEEAEDFVCVIDDSKLPDTRDVSIECSLALGALDYMVKEFGEANPVMREIRDILAPSLFINPPSFEEATVQDEQSNEVLLNVTEKVAVEGAQIRSLGQFYSGKKTWCGSSLEFYRHARRIEAKCKDAILKRNMAEEQAKIMKTELKNQVDAIEHERQRFKRDLEVADACWKFAEAQVKVKDNEVTLLQKRLVSEKEELLAGFSATERKLEKMVDELTDIKKQLEAANAEIVERNSLVTAMSNEIQEKCELISGHNLFMKDYDNKQKIMERKLAEKRALDPPGLLKVGESAKSYLEYLEISSNYFAERDKKSVSLSVQFSLKIKKLEQDLADLDEKHCNLVEKHGILEGELVSANQLASAVTEKFEKLSKEHAGLRIMYTKEHDEYSKHMSHCKLRSLLSREQIGLMNEHIDSLDYRFYNFSSGSGVSINERKEHQEAMRQLEDKISLLTEELVERKETEFRVVTLLQANHCDLILPLSHLNEIRSLFQPYCQHLKILPRPVTKNSECQAVREFRSCGSATDVVNVNAESTQTDFKVQIFDMGTNTENSEDVLEKPIEICEIIEKYSKCVGTSDDAVDDCIFLVKEWETNTADRSNPEISVEASILKIDMKECSVNLLNRDQQIVSLTGPDIGLVETVPLAVPVISLHEELYLTLCDDYASACENLKNAEDDIVKLTMETCLLNVEIMSNQNIILESIGTCNYLRAEQDSLKLEALAWEQKYNVVQNELKYKQGLPNASLRKSIVTGNIIEQAIAAIQPIIIPVPEEPSKVFCDIACGDDDHDNGFFKSNKGTNTEEQKDFKLTEDLQSILEYIEPFLQFVRRNERAFAHEVGKLSVMNREACALVRRILIAVESIAPLPNEMDIVKEAQAKVETVSNLDPAKKRRGGLQPAAISVTAVRTARNLQLMKTVEKIITDIEDNEWIFSNDIPAREVVAMCGAQYDPVEISAQMRLISSWECAVGKLKTIQLSVDENQQIQFNPNAIPPPFIDPLLNLDGIPPEGKNCFTDSVPGSPRLAKETSLEFTHSLSQLTMPSESVIVDENVGVTSSNQHSAKPRDAVKSPTKISNATLNRLANPRVDRSRKLKQTEVVRPDKPTIVHEAVSECKPLHPLNTSIIDWLVKNFKGRIANAGDWRGCIYRSDGSVDVNLSLIPWSDYDRVLILKEMLNALQKEHRKEVKTLRATIETMTQDKFEDSATMLKLNQKIAELKKAFPEGEHRNVSTSEGRMFSVDGNEYVSLKSYRIMEKSLEKACSVLSNLLMHDFNMPIVQELSLEGLSKGGHAKMTSKPARISVLQVGVDQTANTMIKVDEGSSTMQLYRRDRGSANMETPLFLVNNNSIVIGDESFVLPEFMNHPVSSSIETASVVSNCVSKSIANIKSGDWVNAKHIRRTVDHSKPIKDRRDRSKGSIAHLDRSIGVGEANMNASHFEGSLIIEGSQIGGSTELFEECADSEEIIPDEKLTDDEIAALYHKGKQLSRNIVDLTHMATKKFENVEISMSNYAQRLSNHLMLVKEHLEREELKSPRVKISGNRERTFTSESLKAVPVVQNETSEDQFEDSTIIAQQIHDYKKRIRKLQTKMKSLTVAAGGSSHEPSMVLDDHPIIQEPALERPKSSSVVVNLRNRVQSAKGGAKAKVESAAAMTQDDSLKVMRDSLRSAPISRSNKNIAGSNMVLSQSTETLSRLKVKSAKTITDK